MTTKSASTTGQHLPTKHARSQPSALRRSHSLAREEGTGRGYRARGWEGLLRGEVSTVYQVDWVEG